MIDTADIADLKEAHERLRRARRDLRFAALLIDQAGFTEAVGHFVANDLANAEWQTEQRIRASRTLTGYPND